MGGSGSPTPSTTRPGDAGCAVPNGGIEGGAAGTTLAEVGRAGIGTSGAVRSPVMAAMEGFEADAGGDPADTGGTLGRGSDGSRFSSPAWEGPAEAPGPPGPTPFPPGGAFCKPPPLYPPPHPRQYPLPPHPILVPTPAPRRGVSMSLCWS